MSTKNKPIQDKIIELDKLIDWFNGDDFTLELALDKFKIAEALANDIEDDLLSLKNEVQAVKQRFDTQNK